MKTKTGSTAEKNGLVYAPSGNTSIASNNTSLLPALSIHIEHEYQNTVRKWTDRFDNPPFVDKWHDY